MMWHVVFAREGELAQSRAARSRDSAIQVACELLDQSYDVRRIIAPNGSFIERAELDEHYANGRFPGLRRQTQPSIPLSSAGLLSSGSGLISMLACWPGNSPNLPPRTN